MRLFLIFTGVNGFLAVALGAFATHGLQPVLAPAALANFRTGADYHLLHTLALFGTALLMKHYPNAGQLRVAGWLFVLGILLFSGSLYLLSLGASRVLVWLTPLGGLALLAAWASLTLFAVRLRTGAPDTATVSDTGE